jgi:hypothetical protein
LVTAKLAGSTQRLRAQLVSVRLNTSGVCRATAHQLAEAAEEAETAARAIHGDLGIVDIGSLNYDMGTAEEAIGRIGRLKRALIRACR